MQGARVTSIETDLAYNVTLEIENVMPRDAGTYSATDDNGVVEGSDKNVVELIVIGKLEGENIITTLRHHHYQLSTFIIIIIIIMTMTRTQLRSVATTLHDDCDHVPSSTPV